MEDQYMKKEMKMLTLIVMIIIMRKKHPCIVSDLVLLLCLLSI